MLEKGKKYRIKDEDIEFYLDKDNDLVNLKKGCLFFVDYYYKIAKAIATGNYKEVKKVEKTFYQGIYKKDEDIISCTKWYSNKKELLTVVSEHCTIITREFEVEEK